MDNPDDISRLLRLKKYEQPPEGYFDSFLEEFQRRQRAELLRRPLWRIAWDRVSTALQHFEVPRLAYASAFAIAILGAVAVTNVTGPEVGPTAPLASSTPAASAAESVRPALTASTTRPVPVHYVLPTRPVSYAASSHSF